MPNLPVPLFAPSTHRSISAKLKHARYMYKRSAKKKHAPRIPSPMKLRLHFCMKEFFVHCIWTFFLVSLRMLYLYLGLCVYTVMQIHVSLCIFVFLSMSMCVPLAYCMSVCPTISLKGVRFLLTLCASTVVCFSKSMFAHPRSLVLFISLYVPMLLFTRLYMPNTQVALSFIRPF